MSVMTPFSITMSIVPSRGIAPPASTASVPSDASESNRGDDMGASVPIAETLRRRRPGVQRGAGRDAGTDSVQEPLRVREPGAREIVRQEIEVGARRLAQSERPVGAVDEARGADRPQQ